jgi:hypothetical protein
MISEGYDAFEDPYAYLGTNVLQNLLDVRDAKTLEAYETEISTLRAEEFLPDGVSTPLTTAVFTTICSKMSTRGLDNTGR